jgi:DNA-binding IclR family transcriptional regulator
MPLERPRTWSFLTNHAQVLLCIAHDPGIRLREIGDSVGITERAAHRIVSELADAGYISRQRIGRRNRYTVQPDLPISDPLAREQKLSDLLRLHDPRHSRLDGQMVASQSSQPAGST